MGKPSPTTAYPYKETFIRGEKIRLYMFQSNNIPNWFYIVNLSAFIICLLICFVWLICALFTIGKTKPCNHKVHEGQLPLEDKSEDVKKPKKEKNSQRSSRKEAEKQQNEDERNEGGKCSIQIEF